MKAPKRVPFLLNMYIILWNFIEKVLCTHNFFHICIMEMENNVSSISII